MARCSSSNILLVSFVCVATGSKSARFQPEPASVVYSLVNEVRTGDHFELPAMELPR
jgi:hypothetical protein